MTEPATINWGYNCLTQGVHHGRPEPIWNLPLFQALMMFDNAGLKKLVVARIHNDALQFVHHSDTNVSEAWAQKVANLAEERFDDTLTAKLGELETYYDSPECYANIRAAIDLYEQGKGGQTLVYQPLHSHDSINMLCRILGTSCSIEASR
jgi:hypothetical protein